MASQPTAGSQPGEPEIPPETRSASGGVVQTHRIRRTRFGGAWVTAALSAVILLLLLIFILENGQRVSVGYFGARGHLPLGVALLLSAVFGVLLVVIPGTGRILQLRHTARRHRRQDAGKMVPPVSDAQPPPAGQGQPRDSWG